MITLLTALKNKIITRYGNHVVKLQKGYPMGDYALLKEAIEAVDYIDTYSVSEPEKDKIIEFYLLKL